MRKYIFAIFILVFLLPSSVACAPLTEEQKREYGVLESAVTFSAEKVIGEYGDSIPNDFKGVEFMKFIKGRIPTDYYKALKKHQIDVNPKGSYYLILIITPKDNVVILFDYSCTPAVDGPILLEPDKYNVNNIDSYDTCTATGK